jgi:hypothetical protein
MTGATAGLLRVAAGLLAAGILAPFTLALPERWQGSLVLVLLAALCVTGAFVLGRRR